MAKEGTSFILLHLVRHSCSNIVMDHQLANSFIVVPRPNRPTSPANTPTFIRGYHSAIVPQQSNIGHVFRKNHRGHLLFLRVAGQQELQRESIYNPANVYRRMRIPDGKCILRLPELQIWRVPSTVAGQPVQWFCDARRRPATWIRAQVHWCRTA